MDKIKIHFDPTDNSLIIWFDEPEKMAYLSPIEENTPGEFHLIKAENGQVIGIECQFYQLRPGSVSVELETARFILEELNHGG
ncbi:MAG TPA: hypothetical protein VHD90_23840 [Phototrophicaceae bacterium]|nr:hypothetical protein [Phototrophicaceae bacterium]